jgi:DNA processing protein
VQTFGSIELVVRASLKSLERAGLDSETARYLLQPDQALLDSDQEWLSQPGHDLLTWDSDRYPALLRNIASPPAALYTVGDVDTLWQPQLAIIGSRNPTAGGVENARDFTAALSAKGLTITSGLATGIDGIAHQAAIDAGGRTVAITGTGLDRVYPASNLVLARKIRENGVLASEFPPGTAPRRAHFPARNRIISGLSLGVLVIEAALNSGSIITARLAGEQGREVFALPGSIHNPLSKGCHRLIREGAKLVETDTEILQEIAPLAGQLAGSLQSISSSRQEEELEKSAYEPKIGQDPDYKKLWACLGHDPLPVDTIIRTSGLTAKAVSAMLLLLELRGKVETHPGGAFSRKTRGL